MYEAYHPGRAQRTSEGHADIAVVGSETSRVIDERVIDAIPGFIRGLRCLAPNRRV